MDALVLHLLLTQDKQPDEPTPRTDRWDAAVKLAAEKAAARWVSADQPAGRRPGAARARKSGQVLRHGHHRIPRT